MITLTTPYSLSGPQHSNTDPVAKLVSCTANWLPTVLTLTLVFEFGKLVSSVFTADGGAPNAMTIQFSLVSNTWSASDGLGYTANGSLTAAQITAVQNAITAAQTATQNAGETFAAVAGGLLPGTVSAG